MFKPRLAALCLPLLLAACGGGGGSGGGDEGAAPPPSQTSVLVEPCPVGDLATTAAPAINALRSVAQVCGAANFSAVGALSWDARLAEAARAHSTDMAVNNFFSHTGSNGSTLGGRVTGAGYTWTVVAENLAAGPGDLSAALNGWMNSPGHCQNLMLATVTQVGLACVRRQGSGQTPYWTMVLARP